MQVFKRASTIILKATINQEPLIKAQSPELLQVKRKQILFSKLEMSPKEKHLFCVWAL